MSLRVIYLLPVDYLVPTMCRLRVPYRIRVANGKTHVPATGRLLGTYKVKLRVPYLLWVAKG